MPGSGKHKLHKYPRLRLRQVSPAAERWICHLGTHTPPCVSHPGAAGPGNLPAPPLTTSLGRGGSPPADPDPFPFSGWNHSRQDQTPLSGIVGAGTGPRPAPPPGRRTGMDGGGPDPGNLHPGNLRPPGRIRAQRPPPRARPPRQEAPPLRAGSPGGGGGPQ